MSASSRWPVSGDQAGWLLGVTVLRSDGRLVSGDLEIEAGRIGELVPAFSGRRGWDCTGLLAIPGLANAHFHGGSTLLRGLNASLQLADWGDDSPAGREQARLFSWLDEQASEEQLRALIGYEYLAQLRQGITFIADDGLAERRASSAAAVMTEVGIRGVVNAYEQADELVPADPARYLSSLPVEDELTPESLQSAVELAGRLGSPRLATHCLETMVRRDRVFAEFGRSTIEVFAEAGLLGPRTVLYHCVHTDDSDLRVLAASGAALVHCPVSNLFGGDVARTGQWAEHGLTVGIGTDFARTDLWEAMRLAYLLLRGQAGPSASALTILGWASAGGQQAYGYLDRGRIAPGAAADLVLLDLPRIEPLVDRPDLSTAAYAVVADGGPASVRHVLVDGRLVLVDGEPTLVDANAIAAARHELMRRLCA